MVERIGPVQEVTSTTQQICWSEEQTLYLSEGGGISTVVTSPELLNVVGGKLSEPL